MPLTQTDHFGMVRPMYIIPEDLRGRSLYDMLDIVSSNITDQHRYEQNLVMSKAAWQLLRAEIKDLVTTLNDAIEVERAVISVGVDRATERGRKLGFDQGYQAGWIDCEEDLT